MMSRLPRNVRYGIWAVLLFVGLGLTQDGLGNLKHRLALSERIIAAQDQLVQECPTEREMSDRVSTLKESLELRPSAGMSYLFIWAGTCVLLLSLSVFPKRKNDDHAASVD